METLRKFERVCEIVDQNGKNASRLIPILQAVQVEYRYLPEEILTFIATSLGVPPAKVFGVATFYSLFTLKPKGKYIIRVCNGTACHVKKSMDLHAALCDETQSWGDTGHHRRHAFHPGNGELSGCLRPCAGNGYKR